MLPKILFAVFFLISSGSLTFFSLENPSSFNWEKTSFRNREYTREFYSSGKLKSEGWLTNGTKSNYWKFYHPNGKLSEEGHYANGQREKYWHFYTSDGRPERKGHYENGSMTDWWLFYDNNGKINHKCQLEGGKKNGYCLMYVNEKLTSAEKYSHGKKVDEWYSFSSFRRENNLSDLK